MPSRAGRPWVRLVKQVLDRDGHICRTRWDHGCTQVATTGDHIVPFSVAPELELVLENVLASCAHCNRARGSRPLSERPVAPVLVTSRRWL